MIHLCTHPVMSSAGTICTARARYAIVVAGQRVVLHMHGCAVGLLCGRHANSVASQRPGTGIEPLAVPQ